MGNLKKTVILGVTSGIAIYKSCYLVSYLKKRGVDVVVIMTENAKNFVTPLTFETLSNNKVYSNTFFREDEFDVEHIALAKKGSVFCVVPATANFIAKAVHGIADDMLSTTFLAFKKDKIICPAMNTGMYIDKATQDNLDLLKQRGVNIISPVSGHLACGDTGMGKMEEPEVIGEYILNLLRPKRDFEGKKVLVTCGGTVEDIDGVRYMSNYSSGKMGVAIADNIIARGGEVVLVYGNVSVDVSGFENKIKVKSTADMYDVVMQNVENVDVIIKAAAPFYFNIKEGYKNKIKYKSIILEFVPNEYIAKAVGKIKGEKKLVVFAAETENLIENAKAKLQSKNADLMIANNLNAEGAGFNKDTNQVTIIDKNGNMEKTEILSKSEIANIILDKVIKL